MVAKLTILEPHVYLDRVGTKLGLTDPTPAEPENPPRSRIRIAAGLACIGAVILGYRILGRRNGVTLEFDHERLADTVKRVN